jgi:hypothetical protein
VLRLMSSALKKLLSEYVLFTLSSGIAIHAITFRSCIESTYLLTIFYKYSSYQVTLSSPCLWASFHPPIPSFNGICKVKTFLLNLSMKCWNSAFSAQGSTLIVLQFGLRSSENIFSSSGGRSSGKRKDRMKLSFTTKIDGLLSFTKIDGFLSFIPPWMLRYFFAGFFFWISPSVWSNSGFLCCVFLTLWITLLSFVCV